MLTKNIKILRTAMDLSIKEASKKAGIEACLWNKIELGKNSPTVTTLEKVASALETSIENLFKEKIEV